MHPATCPICHQENGKLVRHWHPATDRPLIDRLRRETPHWHPGLGACTRCIDQAQVDGMLEWPAAWPGDGSFGEINGYKILPTPVRAQAHPGYTGKGVTICLIDSGFYPHPDLTEPENRILAFHDLAQPGRAEATFRQPHPHSWHGLMTSTVCAGNGRLSGGLYRGIASDAKLVLLKVMQENGRISDEHIAEALRWAIRHKDDYGIRIINLSLSGDYPPPGTVSIVEQAVTEALKAGIVIVAAAGNDPTSGVAPPASAPGALTIGGLDDHNTLDPLQVGLYHSTFGRTPDGFFKPEIIAPAIWIAAPLLPGTPEQQEAALLAELWQTPDRYLAASLANNIHLLPLDRQLLRLDAAAIREALGDYIDRRKVISPHYQHADGTSFAAPIVSGVIAQMLEARPGLTPAEVKTHLLATARPLPDAEGVRQGFGVLQPTGALLAAVAAPDAGPWNGSPVVDYRNGKAIFSLEAALAQQVYLSGSFTRWTSEAIAMERHPGGRWSAQVALPSPGVHPYKFVVDGRDWLPDPANPFREPDGFNGFNSQLIIHRF